MPKRSTWTGAIVVYRYGTPVGWDLPDEALGHLRLAHTAHNALVDAWHEYR